MGFVRKYFGLVLVLLLSIFAILPLFRFGFFPVHDDTQVVRIYEMGKALRDGMFPVRWVADLGYGYGYPIFNFYAPLAYYVGGLFNVLGFDALIATKLMIGLGIILSGVFMYLLAREFWGEMGGVLAGLFYVYAPYHAVDIYVRGDVGEFWAYAFIPLMFLGSYKIFTNSKEISNVKFQMSNFKWVAVGSVGFAGVILSHNLTAMMVTPFLLIVLLFYCFIVFRNHKLSAIRYPLSAFILGLLLSAFYWLPALLEMKYTNVLSQVGGGANFRDHFVCIQQLWNSPWGFGGSTKGCIDGMFFKIGKLHLLAVLTTIVVLMLFLIFRKKDHFNDMYHYSGKVSAILLAIFGFLGSIFLTLEISKPIWEVLPFMAFFQYPWRFLLLASFFSSFLAGAVFWYFKDFRFKLLASCLLLIILLFYHIKYFQPQKYLSVSANDYVSETNIKWTASKISDEYMPKDFLKPKSKEEVAINKIVFDSKVKINSLRENTQSVAIDLTALQLETRVYINIAHFPSWKAFIDRKEAVFQKTKNGYILLVSPGRKLINIQFTETPIEKLANILSLAGVSLFILGIIPLRKRFFS